MQGDGSEDATLEDATHETTTEAPAPSTTEPTAPSEAIPSPKAAAGPATQEHQVTADDDDKGPASGAAAKQVQPALCLGRYVACTLFS